MNPCRGVDCGYGICEPTPLQTYRCICARGFTGPRCRQNVTNGGLSACLSVCPSVCLSVLQNFFISYRKLHNFLFMPNTCNIIHVYGLAKIERSYFILYCHTISTKSLSVTGPTTPDPCQSQPCQHGGTCRPLAADKFACECGQGRDGLVYRGDHCEVEGGYCDSSPCVSGQCVPTEHSYR